MDYRKNPAGLLDKLKSSGANVDGSTRKLKERVSDTRKAGSIAKVRSYLIKYLSKGLYKEWSPAELLFNAVLWKTKTRMWGCSRNFSKIMKPEIQECEDWECSEVWLCDTSEDEEPDLVWSKERKETGLLGYDKNSKSLVDCEKETTHHSIYTQPRSVSMKEYDNKLLRDVCNSESTFYNHIRLRVSKPDWIFIQSVPSLTDSMLKKISSGMLRAEEHTIEVFNKSGVSSFISEYWLYEPILETSFIPSPISYSLQPSSSVESCSCRTTHAKRFARRKKKRLLSKG